MRADYNIYVKFRFDEITEVVNVRAWRVTYHHTCREMNNFGAIFLHFFNTIFNVTTRTSSTRGIPDEFYSFALVYAESPFSVS
jgi:hypothetical protein